MKIILKISKKERKDIKEGFLIGIGEPCRVECLRKFCPHKKHNKYIAFNIAKFKEERA